MTTAINQIQLAFLLALTELEKPLSEIERQNLAEVGDQLDIQPKAWDNFTQPILLNMIESNSQLKQRYQFYKTKLENLEALPLESFLTEEEYSKILNQNKSLVLKGLSFHSQPNSYHQQINNAVITVTRSNSPEEEVKQLTFLEKVKQYVL